ncbi:protoporphyrinogen oxidase [Nocardioides marinus]|uniref:Coproporphyrinogen III oxidase n=1 Tax=Nocardioides marinus TaxID=374514 RepID=A0A7Y9YB90_9ACTN|nr:oxygen-dependent protoporphyrinogen oxidase [Nocardioides marinus]
MGQDGRDGQPGEHREVVVVGAGIGGLSAAYQLQQQGRDVLVLEGSPQVGGVLRRRSVAGVPVDVGAEAMLNRRPEGVDLAAALGLEVCHPTVASSRIWTRDALRPLPRSLMGVPLDLDDLSASGVLTDAELARVREESGHAATPVGDDVTVGDLVDDRLGRAVTDRLVEPLLGGVYAGHARRISARAAVPQLVALAERGSLLDQAPGLTGPSTYSAPVFAGLPGGMGGLPSTLAERLEVRTRATVRRLGRVPVHGGHRFALTVGPTTDERTITADAVVLAVPAAAASRLLAELAPEAGRLVGGIEAASVAVVTLALRVADAGALAETDASGFLVPPVEQRAIKAATFSFAKWGWVREAGAADGLIHLRTSLGRHGEEAALQASDDELVAVSLRDLHDATGLHATPVDTHVQRWGGGLPQYALGHLDRVARVRAALEAVPGLAVCGAAYDGVGIPAVIGSAQRAVADVTA